MNFIIYLILVLVILFILLSLKKIRFEDMQILEDYYSKFSSRFDNYGNNKNLDSVDCVYCIAMPKRKDYVIGKMNELGVNFKLLNAITPDDVNDSDYSILSVMHTYKSIFALQMSFTMCFMDAINNGYSNIIVFEDDITINTDFNSLNNIINEFVQSKFVLFYMGYCYLDCSLKFENNNNLVDVRDNTILCTHAIVYKVKYLYELLNSIWPMKQAYDWMLLKSLRINKYYPCIPKKILFDQNRTDFSSTLGNGGILNTCEIK